MASIRFLLLAAILILGGCPSDKKSISGVSQHPTSVQSDANAHKPRIALVMKTLTNPFFIEMEKGARRAERENNIELLVKTASQETSIEQQIQIVEDLIGSGVDAIVIAPGDSTRLIPVIKKAKDQGLAVINIDNQLDPEALKRNGLSSIPFISVDNEKAAYLSAKYIADQIRSSTQVAIFEGIRSANNAQLRRNGALRAFSENKNIKVVTQESAHWKIDEAHDLARTVFKQHPDIKAIFCANDMMALGLIEYLRKSRHAPVLVAGFDALEEAKVAIREGHMGASVDQQAGEQGYQGVIAALRSIRKEPVPSWTEIPAKLITKESLQ